MAINPRPSDSSRSNFGFETIAGLTSINFPFTPVWIKIGSSWPFTLTAKIGDVSCKNWKIRFDKSLSFWTRPTLPDHHAFVFRKLYFLNDQLFRKLCMKPILFLDLLLDDLDANSWSEFYLNVSKFEQDRTNAENKGNWTVRGTLVRTLNWFLETQLYRW